VSDTTDTVDERATAEEVSDTVPEALAEEATPEASEAETPNGV
jgi:hypothetical protein